jgi:hypothetical protein
MRQRPNVWVGGFLGLVWASMAGVGCGDDDGNEADRAGVAAQCTTTADCPAVSKGETAFALTCLTTFKGGYCGASGCTADADCPDGAACVNHDDGNRYCFRVCTEKLECNRHRDADVEANCSASVDFVNNARMDKACIPPSSGI